MKKLIIITICTLTLLSVNASTGMSVQIELLSSNYHISGWASASSAPYTSYWNLSYNIQSSSPGINYSTINGSSPMQEEYVATYSEAHLFYNYVSAGTGSASSAMVMSESSYIFRPFTSNSETIVIFHHNDLYGDASAQLLDLTDGAQIFAYQSWPEGSPGWGSERGLNESVFTIYLNSNHLYELSLFSRLGSNNDNFGPIWIGSSDFKVSEPSAMVLLGGGLVGLLGYGRRWLRSSRPTYKV